MYRVEVFKAGDVDHMWPNFTDGIEETCVAGGGDITSEYLWSECRAGRAFLIGVWRQDGEDGEWVAGSVWRFEKWTTGMKLRCLVMYGRLMGEWLPLHRRVITNLAAMGHATALVTEGRKGFERIFPEAQVLRQIYEVQL